MLPLCAGKRLPEKVYTLVNHTEWEINDWVAFFRVGIKNKVNSYVPIYTSDETNNFVWLM